MKNQVVADLLKLCDQTYLVDMHSGAKKTEAYPFSRCIVITKEDKIQEF